jgi:hypothetical protein
MYRCWGALSRIAVEPYHLSLPGRSASDLRCSPALEPAPTAWQNEIADASRCARRQDPESDAAVP